MLNITSRLALCLSFAFLIACDAGPQRVTSPTPAPPASPPSLTLSGSVRNTGGSVVAGATVTIGDDPSSARSTTTDVSGRYSFTGLQLSGFTIVVSAPNHISQTQSVALSASRTMDFRLRPQPQEVTLTGHVTDEVTGAPLAGAVVGLVRYSGTTDGSGSYTITGMLDYGFGAFTYTTVTAEGHVADYRYVRGPVQNVRLPRIERIVAGESKSVTVAPGDSLCVNNVQDTPGLTDHVCRSVFIVAPRDGAITVEAVSASGGSRPPLEVETVGTSPCCSARLGNPTTIQVTAGTVIVVNVEMLATETSPQAFIVNTSLSPE